MTSQILPRSRTPSGTSFIERGHGASTVVLVHGVGMSADAWHPQLDRLSVSHRVIALDLPGHGGSLPLAGEPLLPDFLRWISRTLDELELDVFSLVGHSLGALIVAGAVSAMPQRVERVALLNCVHIRTPEARKAVVARADEIFSGRFDREAPLFRWFTPQQIGSEPYSFVRSLLQEVDQAGYAAAYRAFATGDREYAGIWNGITCPALFITGDGDPNSTPEMSQTMASSARNGNAVIIPDHRHMVNLTAPEMINDLLLDWLAVKSQPAPNVAGVGL